LLSGFLTPTATIPVGADPSSIAISELDSPFFVAANRGDGTVSVHFFGSEGAIGPVDDYAVGDGPSAVALANFNNPNGSIEPDIAVANYNDGTVSILYNNGSGTNFTAGQVLPVGDGPDAIATGNLDTTLFRYTDIVTANRLDGTVSVLLRGRGGVFLPTVETYQVGNQPDAVAVGDLNGDGIPDIVTANYADGTVSVLYGEGAGAFAPAETFSVGPHPTSVALANFDAPYNAVVPGVVWQVTDFVDIVTSNAGDNTVSILSNQGSSQGHRIFTG